MLRFNSQTHTARAELQCEFCGNKKDECMHLGSFSHKKNLHVVYIYFNLILNAN